MQIVFSSVFVVVVLLSVLTTTTAIRCYICGPGAQLPFKHSKNFNDFHKNSTKANGNRGYNENNHQAATMSTTLHQTNSLLAGAADSCQTGEEKNHFRPQEFALECPAEYGGCITEIEGNRTTRTCEILAINDCKIANNITYCYCNTDLCNGERVSILTSRAWKSNAVHGRRPMQNPDDEDADEFTEYSSGMDDEQGEGYRKRKNGIKSTQYDGGNKQAGLNTAAATATCKAWHIQHLLLLQSAICLCTFYSFRRIFVFTFQIG